MKSNVLPFPALQAAPRDLRRSSIAPALLAIAAGAALMVLMFLFVRWALS